MEIELTKLSTSELESLHDSYFASDEPDAPQNAFASLSKVEQAAALSQFDPSYHFTAHDGNTTIGFVGVYPDDKFENIGIFYVITPASRGKGYLTPLLRALVLHCRQHHTDYKVIRALTRKSNLASLRGLEKAGFVRKGECVQDLGFSVSYEEYILPI